MRWYLVWIRIHNMQTEFNTPSYHISCIYKLPNSVSGTLFTFKFTTRKGNWLNSVIYMLWTRIDGKYERNGTISTGTQQYTTASTGQWHMIYSLQLHRHQQLKCGRAISRLNYRPIKLPRSQTTGYDLTTFTVTPHGLPHQTWFYTSFARYPPFLLLGSHDVGPAMLFADCCGRQNTATPLMYRKAFPNLQATLRCYRLCSVVHTFDVPFM